MDDRHLIQPRLGPLLLMIIKIDTYDTYIYGLYGSIVVIISSFIYSDYSDIYIWVVDDGC